LSWHESEDEPAGAGRVLRGRSSPQPDVHRRLGVLHTALSLGLLRAARLPQPRDCEQVPRHTAELPRVQRRLARRHDRGHGAHPSKLGTGSVRPRCDVSTAVAPLPTLSPLSPLVALTHSSSWTALTRPGGKYYRLHIYRLSLGLRVSRAALPAPAVATAACLPACLPACLSVCRSSLTMVGARHARRETSQIWQSCSDVTICAEGQPCHVPAVKPPPPPTPPVLA
jgi:hypothetical protein